MRAFELYLSWTSSCLHDLCEEALVPNIQKYEKSSQKNSSLIVNTFRRKRSNHKQQHVDIKKIQEVYSALVMDF